MNGGMDERYYTDEELEEAKAYLRDRIRNERSMSADVERLLVIWAGYLLRALWNGASDDVIEELIADLVAQLLGDCELLAVDEHDRDMDVLLYMNGERNGDTLEGRVRKRAGTFFDEVYAVFIAGQLLGKGREALLKSIRENLKAPWENEVLKEARALQQSGEIDADFSFESPHFGKGVEISSLGALQTITSYAVADAWTWWQREDALARGAKGYSVVRGSSYPCEECDMAASVFHLMSDTEHLVPLHLHCVCMIVYSYVERV